MLKIYEIDDKDERYPKKLLKIKRHPKKLYVMGNLGLLKASSVAMVGSRDNSLYGRKYASLFANEIAKAGITVVSGLAIGIDSICHENSMKEIGRTIAVIGSGFNNIYPSENIKLVQEILENGGTIVSEYPPDKEINLSNFPIRNRIIAGLSDCTIVVEAKSRSGSGITAKYAFEQEKPVFCIPGRIGDKTGKGTNFLIKSGAIILTDVNDVLALFGKRGVEIQESSEVFVKDEYMPIYKLCSGEELSADEIARTLNTSIAEINVKLTMMELEGLIEFLPGNMVRVKEVY